MAWKALRELLSVFIIFHCSFSVGCNCFSFVCYAVSTENMEIIYLLHADVWSSLWRNWQENNVNRKWLIRSFEMNFRGRFTFWLIELISIKLTLLAFRKLASWFSIQIRWCLLSLSLRTNRKKKRQRKKEKSSAGCKEKSLMKGNQGNDKNTLRQRFASRVLQSCNFP